MKYKVMIRINGKWDPWTGTLNASDGWTPARIRMHICACFEHLMPTHTFGLFELCDRKWGFMEEIRMGSFRTTDQPWAAHFPLDEKQVAQLSDADLRQLYEVSDHVGGRWLELFMWCTRAIKERELDLKQETCHERQAQRSCAA